MKNVAAVATIAFALVLAWGSSSAEAAKNTLNIDFDKCALAAIDHLGQFGVKKDDVTDYNFVEVAEGGRSGIDIEMCQIMVSLEEPPMSGYGYEQTLDEPPCGVCFPLVSRHR